jgi:hypothetical protein
MTYTDTMQLESTGLPKAKPAHHQTLIVRIPEPRVHTNADSLELFDILGYQLVAKKGNYRPGDLAVYIQPDSVVPQIAAFNWLWEEKLARPEMCQHVAESGGSSIIEHDGRRMCLRCMATIVNGGQTALSEKSRRITVRKFRKEFSEGLLMPLADLPELTYGRSVVEGDDVSDVLGITHYEGEEDTDSESLAAPKRKRRPNSIRGWLRYFYYNTVRFLSGGRAYRQEASMEVKFDAPEYDVVSMKAARSGFDSDEMVVVTEKLHGSNGRFLYLDGTFYVGSHYQWKAPNTPNIFNRVAVQQPWIKEWCMANEGRILYGEVIGDQKGYTYGLDKSKGQLEFRAFDIWEPNGAWTKPWTATDLGVFRDRGLITVPFLYHGPADMDKIKALTDGKSVLDGKTQREGVVVSEGTHAAEGHRRPRQVKRVSNVFLEGDSK